MTALPNRVTIVEVGPRDGLQNEARAVSVDDKVRLIEALVSAGLRVIEGGSFVPPGRVPQMAGTAEVFARIPRADGRRFPALVPNLKGLDVALRAGVETIAIFPAATESFSRANLNASMADSFARFADVARAAIASGLKVRGSVSCALHCPFEGFVPPEVAADMATRMLDLGCYEVVLCDTTGAGTPGHTRALIEAVLESIPPERLAVHFHDTFGQALANALVALQHGISVVDAAVAGLGGCPYSPGATGNLATEDLVYMLDGMGIETGVSLQRLTEAGRAICDKLGKSPDTRAGRALAARAARTRGS